MLAISSVSGDIFLLHLLLSADKMTHRINSLLCTLVVLCIVFVCTPAFSQDRNLTVDHRLHEKFDSQFAKDRDLIVWLPPKYEAETTRRFPTLYMHDGDSAFVNWRLDETALALISSGEIEPMIIIYVPNGGSQEDRFIDYTPSHDPNYVVGGGADKYGRMLVEEIKPFIDSHYRTLTDAANTGLGGASLGGLATLYLGLKHPGVFGRLAVLSPSVWWDRGVLLRKVKELDSKPATRIWLDVGTEEEAGRSSATRLLRDALIKKGWTLNSDLMYYEAKGAHHEEKEFGKRAGLVLKFLYAKRVAQ
jgi:predicted alpha/beta superfamily hydrolase